MQNSKFYTKTGWLTQYALACGYLETNQGWKQKRIVSMFFEGACYHVQAYNAEEQREYWESFETLPQARQSFKEQLALRKAKRHINKE